LETREVHGRRLFLAYPADGAVVEATERQAMFVRHHDALRRFVRRIASSEDEAQEIVQDVAVVLFAHRTGPSDPGSLAFWCRGVARHLAAHRRRGVAVAERPRHRRQLERTRLQRRLPVRWDRLRESAGGLRGAGVVWRRLTSDLDRQPASTRSADGLPDRARDGGSVHGRRRLEALNRSSGAPSESTLSCSTFRA